MRKYPWPDAESAPLDPLPSPANRGLAWALKNHTPCAITYRVILWHIQESSHDGIAAQSAGKKD